MNCAGQQAGARTAGRMNGGPQQREPQQQHEECQDGLRFVTAQRPLTALRHFSLDVWQAARCARVPRERRGMGFDDVRIGTVFRRTQINYLKKSPQPFEQFKLVCVHSCARCAVARAFLARIVSSGTGPVELKVEHRSPPVATNDRSFLFLTCFWCEDSALIM